MLLRWTVCRVSEEDRSAFSKSQTLWSHSEHCRGFLGQIGGWVTSNRRESCLANFWEDNRSYDAFMRSSFDLDTYDPLEETFLSMEFGMKELLLEIPGQASDWFSALTKAHYLSITEYRIKRGQVAPFLAMQRQVWRPGFQLVPGHFFSLLFRDQHNPHSFLTLRLWEEAGFHQEFRYNKSIVLTELSHLKEHAVEVVERLVSLEDGWFLKPHVSE